MRVIIELVLPMLTLALSTPTATQFSHGMWYEAKQLSMAANSSSAVPPVERQW